MLSYTIINIYFVTPKVQEHTWVLKILFQFYLSHKLQLKNNSRYILNGLKLVILLILCKSSNFSLSQLFP